MSDQQEPPIIVNAEPTPDQIAAGLRQAVTVLGPIVAILAATGWGERLNLNVYFTAFIGSIGAISTVAAIIVGQLHTRSLAKTAAFLANKLPNSVAIAVP